MMILRVCGLLMFIALPAAAQQRADLPARLGPSARAAITALADSLGASGLPAGALYDKAAEGVLKGASDVQILAVVRALAARLRDSRSLLGAEAPHDALLAAAAALYAGVPDNAIRRAATAQRSHSTAPSLALTLTVLGTLVSQQVPADVATESLELLLRRGARDFDLQAFQRGIEGDIVDGGSPLAATSRRTESVLRAIDNRRKPEP